MVKPLHIILTLLAIFTLCSTPAMANGSSTAEFECMASEPETNAIAVNVEDNTLHIKNAEGMVAEIFSVTGEKVYSARIDSNNKAIELQGIKKGCYIIRIGKFTRKIYIG